MKLRKSVRKNNNRHSHSKGEKISHDLLPFSFPKNRNFSANKLCPCSVFSVRFFLPKQYNRLNQQFNPSAPNQVWVSDVTYFRFNNKNYYICAVMDLYARTIIAYRISFKNSTQLVKSTFRQAYETRQPQQNLIFHSDRGTNYRSYSFCSYLKSLHVEQSFSRTHTPYDNSVIESFFSSMKREELYRTKYLFKYELKKR